VKALLLLLISAYDPTTAPHGGLAISAYSVELPSMALCKQAGEAYKSMRPAMGPALVEYRCLELPAEK
jgi:hypothetical protein